MSESVALPRIGVCHAPDGAANLREIYVAARGLCEVVLLVDPRTAALEDFMAVARRFFECRTVPEDGHAAFLAPLGLRGATTFHDDLLDTADLLHGLLHPGAASTVERPWDKLVQRRLLHRAGLTAVRAAAVDGPADLAREFAALGGPCVLKPRRAAGGRGIAFLDGEEDLRRQLGVRTDWSDLMLETRIEPAPHPSGVGWLGSLVSVETVTFDRNRLHLGVLDKLPVAVARGAGRDGADAVNVQGDLLPSRLPDRLRREAAEYTGRILDALDVGPRVTHTELQLTPDGFELIEVNGRLAGHTARLFRLVDGPDPVRVALQVALGEPPEADLSAMRGAAAGLFPTFADRDGDVRTGLRARDLRALPGVRAVDELARPGDPKSATQYRMANVTVRGEDRPSLDTAVDEVLRALAAGFAPAGR
ncbi:ATP-grasp domain-containing protein [Kitasatospora sp. NPDC085879]|uniref:ATP-grasp domain-containing protein n=1 Tax=Kitasatospora sp. NPDC085879 TaxID=3154769 RepID=UPI00344056DC